VFFTLALVAAVIAQPPAALGPVEQAQGFRLYTGSNATSMWRGYKQPSFPAKGWALQNGELTTAKGGGGGDLITTDQFGDVEMLFEFKLGEKANSGVMFRVAETDGPTYMTGPEYQLLEDATYGVKPTDPHACGALYDLYPPAAGKAMKPAGEWNSGRIYLRNGVIQHWLNGVKVVEATIFDDAGKPTREWADKIAASKFKDAKGFGVLPRGHIAIQDHGDTELSLRNILIRDPAAPMPGEKILFNGKDLSGWEPIVPEAKSAGIEPASVWSVQDGILICKGNPVGYIRTREKFANYVLKVEWRFNPVTKKAGNSGVLLRMVGEDKVWPKSVEAQLESGNAGDFWNIDNVRMTVDPARTKGRNTKHTHGAERPIGEWNEYEIVVSHGDVVLKVNGEELNRASAVEEVPGYICLQSEGAEIQFRSVRLAPLE
jgi:3-keto-disaccharide hydrolase